MFNFEQMESWNEENFLQFSDDLRLQRKSWRNISSNGWIQRKNYAFKRPKRPAEEDCRNSDSVSIRNLAEDVKPYNINGGSNKGFSNDFPTAQKRYAHSGFGLKLGGPNKENHSISTGPSLSFSNNSKDKSFRSSFLVNGTITKGYRIGRKNRLNVIREDYNRDCKNGVDKISNLSGNQTNLGGYIFVCNNDAIADNVKRQIFGSSHRDYGYPNKNCSPFWNRKPVDFSRSVPNRELEHSLVVDLENGTNTPKTGTDQTTFAPGFQNLQNGCLTFPSREVTTFSRNADERKPCSLTPSCHAFIEYMIPMLLTLVTLKYQGKTVSLFEENPVQAWSFLVTACVYWLIEGLMKRMQPLDAKSFLRFDRAALVSGAISAISLVSILFPRPASLLLFLVGACLAVVLPVLYHAYEQHEMGITDVFNRIWSASLRAEGTNLNEESRLPV